MSKNDENKGLYVKYEVRKKETGEIVDKCFVLRPDRDPVAREALLAYADATSNYQLAMDIRAWMWDRPTVVCLCGSTRFGEAFQKANFDETIAGRIVLSIGCNLKSDDQLFEDLTIEEKNLIKRNLDDLHKRKIDMADEILVLNVGGYIGESTKSEIHYAKTHGKRIRFLEQVIDIGLI